MVEVDGTYSTPVSGSATAPCQFAPPCEPGTCSVPRFVEVTTEGGLNSGPKR